MLEVAYFLEDFSKWQAAEMGEQALQYAKQAGQKLGVRQNGPGRQRVTRDQSQHQRHLRRAGPAEFLLTWRSAGTRQVLDHHSLRRLTVSRRMDHLATC